MAEILKKDDFKRVELLNLVTKKGGMRNLSLEQLILLDELLKKKDYSNEEKAEKSSPFNFLINLAINFIVSEVKSVN